MSVYPGAPQLFHGSPSTPLLEVREPGWGPSCQLEVKTPEGKEVTDWLLFALFVDDKNVTTFVVLSTLNYKTLTYKHQYCRLWQTGWDGLSIQISQRRLWGCMIYEGVPFCGPPALLPLSPFDGDPMILYYDMKYSLGSLKTTFHKYFIIYNLTIANNWQILLTSS